MHNKNFFIGLIIGALIAGALSFIFYRGNLLKTQNQYHQLHISRQAELIDSMRRSDLGHLMNNVLEKVDNEVSNNPKRNLSKERIASIVALSHLLKPYSYNTGDSVSDKKLSPERGQILLMLLAMNIDSASLQKIMLQASFAGAVLREADLRGANLKWVDLSGADLQEANLQGVNLSEANLIFANLWGANLSAAKLAGTVLERADLRWADLNGTDLRRANLKGADLSAAQLRKADLSEANLQVADLNGAILFEANLAGADLFRTKWKRALLKGADLSETNLVYADFTEADLTSSNLTGAELGEVIVANEQWLKDLNDLSVTGAKEIQSTYSIKQDNSKKQAVYRLNKNKD